MGETLEMAKVSGAGGDGAVSADELQTLQDAVSEINRDSEKYWTLRLNAEATRFQKWDGQSPDGKQRMEFMGSMPFPFDGASDQRVYWADMLVSERVRLFTVAARRATVNCLPVKKGRSDQAWQATQVLRWFVRQMKQRWWRELIRCANYATADSPAVAVLKIWWERTRELELQRLTAGELAELYVRLAGEGATDPAEIRQAALEFEARLSTEESGDEELADLVMAYFDVRPARARKAVRQLREEGAAEFPVPGEWQERLKVKALRYADNFYMPDATEDWESCPYWFECEWLDRPALLERAEREGWNEEFLTQVQEHAGDGGFNEYQVKGNVIEKTARELHEHQYHLITAHYRAVSDDGVSGRYSCVFNTLVAGLTAYGRRLERDCAAVFFGGEIVDGWLLNSRGIPERIGPAAGVLKGMKDDMSDGARMMLLPPVVGDGYGTGKEETINLEPLAYLPLKRGGKLQYMQGMQYPAHALEAMKAMRDDRDEQFSRAGETVPQTVSDTATEYEVMQWLGFVQEAHCELMRLIARNVSDETLAQIVDRGGQPAVPEGRGMLAGAYDVEVTFDATTLDEERTIKKFGALTQMKQADTENVLYMTPMIKAGTRALFPHHADEALQKGDEGQEGEWEQERTNYLSLRAGVMPKMVDDGTWNYEMRLRFYVELFEANPAAMADVGEDKREMMAQWMKFLQQQATQYGENRETGRTGVRQDEG